MNRIYADYNATAPVLPEVIQKMTEVMSTIYGNPSSTHSAGRLAKDTLEQARDDIAQSINVPAREIVFCSGGTEADNLAILGCLTEPCHIITSSIEHPAVFETFIHLQSLGFEVDFIKSDINGVLDLDSLKEKLRLETKLVSIMYANNETGVINPISEIAALLNNHPCYFHVDAVQAWGRIPLETKAIDFMSLSGHKIGGPKGIGALWARASAPLVKQSFGGPHERENRSGTEALPAIVGMSEAAKLIKIESFIEKTKPLQEYFEKELQEKLDVVIIGSDTRRMSNTSCVLFKGCKQDMLLMALDIHGVEASAGSACAAGSIKYSRIVKDLGYTEEEASSSIRFSFGKNTTLHEIQTIVNHLCKLVPMQLSL